MHCCSPKSMRRWRSPDAVDIAERSMTYIVHSIMLKLSDKQTQYVTQAFTIAFPRVEQNYYK